MHKMFLCQSGQEKFFWVFCFSLSSLCVSCYLSEWKASLSHGQACFLVVSVMRRSVNISWLWVGVNLLEKSLKTVKYKTKSMCISLSLWFPLPATRATHLPPLYRLPDTTSAQRLQLDVKAHKGGGGGGRDGHIPLEPRGRHARHHLNVKTASAASSAPYEWGRPNPPTPRSIRWKIRSLQEERKKLLNSFTANVAAHRWLKMTFYPVKCVWVMMHFLPFSFPFAPTWDHHDWDLIWFDTAIYMQCVSEGSPMKLYKLAVLL